MASTDIGSTNRNDQKVIEKTDIPGTDHGQVVYILHCKKCGNEYGSNGTQTYERKCPKCQGGESGLAFE